MVEISMTYSNPKTYEFTALTEDELGGNCAANCVFIMPTFATVCITATDNDVYLSGDYCVNENADDSTYQTAVIENDGAELGNGGQIYAEKYWTLSGSNGQTYYLIEIEQEGGDDDYFAFYGDVPPAGTTLTATECCNVTSEWINYNCLGAGEKEPNFRECNDPNAAIIDFEKLSTGEFATTQYDGVTITAQRKYDDDTSPNDAMVFDSFNPTGGDSDLATSTQGNLLIISEDGNQGDPDDNARGGVITVSFDTPATVHDFKIIDLEEGGTIRLFDEAGNLLKTLSTGTTANGGIAQVIIDQDNVSIMEITLAGSGAIDDICYTPGMENSVQAENDDAFIDESALIISALAVGNALLNDSDPEGDLFAVTSVSGDAVADGAGWFGWVAGSNGGEIRVNINGDYELRDLNGDFDLVEGVTRATSIDYTITDAQGATDTATITITVTGENSVEAEDDGATFIENIINEASAGGVPVYVGNVYDNDNDPEGDDFVITQLGTDTSVDANGWFGWVSADNGGQIRVNVNGDYEFRVGQEGFDISEDETIVTGTSYTITDSKGATDTANIDITILGNKPGNSVSALDDLNGFSVSEILDGSVGNEGISAGNVYDNDSDPEGDRFEIVILETDDFADPDGWLGWVDGSAGGQIRVNLNGEYQFRANPGEFLLSEGQSIVTKASYGIEDEFGAEAFADIEITVLGDDAPLNSVVANDDELTFINTDVRGMLGNMGEFDAGNIYSNDNDPEGDAFVITQLGDDTTADSGGWFGWVTAEDGGKFRVSTNGDYQFQPTADMLSLFPGVSLSSSTTYEITDAQGATDTATIMITLTGADTGGF
jgi:hypothetical protein